MAKLELPDQGAPLPGYEHPLIATAFDAVIGGMFLPFGGVNTLRTNALDRIGVSRGTRVLELGCGTGAITQLMLARGADVVAVDGAPRMLQRATRRAERAVFHTLRLEQLGDNAARLGGPFDVVLCAFVLHELPVALRAQLLRDVRPLLSARGRIAILDHAVPSSAAVARAWRTLLLKLEPPSVRDCIEHGYERELERAGYDVDSTQALASGTAQLTLARLRSERALI